MVRYKVIVPCFFKKFRRFGEVIFESSIETKEDLIAIKRLLMFGNLLILNPENKIVNSQEAKKIIVNVETKIEMKTSKKEEKKQDKPKQKRG